MFHKQRREGWAVPVTMMPGSGHTDKKTQQCLGTVVRCLGEVFYWVPRLEHPCRRRYEEAERFFCQACGLLKVPHLARWQESEIHGPGRELKTKRQSEHLLHASRTGESKLHRVLLAGVT